MSDATMTSEFAVDEVAPVTVAPKKKGVFRLLALLLLAVCGATFFLKVNVFYGFLYNDTEYTVLDTLKNLFDEKFANEKIFKFFPVFVNVPGTIGKLANLAIYGLVGAVAVAAVAALLALLTGSSRLVNFSAFVLLFGALAYACLVYFVSTLKTPKSVLDTWTLSLAGAGLLIAFLAKWAKNGKVAWLWLVQMLLVVDAAVVALMGLAKEYDVAAPWNTLTKCAYLLTVALVLVAMLIFASKKANLFTAFLALAVAAAILCLILLRDDVNGDKIYAIAAVAATAVLFVSTFFKCKKKAPVVAEEAAAPAPVEEYRKETFVEAYAYDGGPVAGVQLAEEVFPTVAAIDAQKDPDGTARNTVASLLGNGFDPFLIMLNEQEKEEFIDLYILKCKGEMPEIPGYVVGGNNKEFFNCVFIYLGQYREKIPAALLEKMYKFSMKI